MRDYEVVDLGIHHPDYFQGFGVSFTEFDNCTYGIGCDPAEALDDCLEMAAQMNEGEWDWDKIERDILADFPDFANPDTWPTIDYPAEGEEYNETYYHVGIRWKEEGKNNER